MRALPLALLLAGCVAAGPPPRPSPATVAPAPAVTPTPGTLAAAVAATPSLATFARAVATAALTQTLSGPEALTLFAPTDQAFGRLAPGTTDALLKPDNRASLTKLVQLHLVPGRFSAAELTRRVEAGGGRASLITVSGEPLDVTLTGSVVTLTDNGGNKSYIETADLTHANGTMHIVNGVLIPRVR